MVTFHGDTDGEQRCAGGEEAEGRGDQRAGHDEQHEAEQLYGGGDHVSVFGEKAATVSWPRLAPTPLPAR